MENNVIRQAKEESDLQELHRSILQNLDTKKYNVVSIHDSIVITRRKKKMKMSEDILDIIEIVEDLNNNIASRDIKTEIQFNFNISPVGFIIEFQEIKETGLSLVVFDSNENIPEDIEEEWEKDNITYQEMMVDTIRYNLKKGLESIRETFLII